jgi:hypothetical protein
MHLSFHYRIPTRELVLEDVSYRSANGNEKVKQLPCPTWLSRVIDPP